jgi:uridine phosphorylase
MTDRDSAENPQNEEGRQYHVGVAPGEIAGSILLVGDPARAERVSGMFDEIELERRHREYVTYTGNHDGLRVTVVGTGMGPDNTEMAVIELCQCVDEPIMIRCGSCGALQDDIGLGDLVISQGAFRMENTSLQFVGEGYPAVGHPEVLMALTQAADSTDRPFHVGITATAPGFYGAQGREIPGFPSRRSEVTDELAKQGVKNLEMETSCLFTLASLRGFRAGAVCAVYASRPRNAFIDDDARDDAELACTKTGLSALHLLAKMDRERGKRANWHPGLVRGK